LAETRRENIKPEGEKVARAAPAREVMCAPLVEGVVTRWMVMDDGVEVVWGAGRRMTRKGKEREKVGVEGREYLISKSRVRVGKSVLTHIIGWQRPQWAIKPTMGWVRPGRKVGIGEPMGVTSFCAEAYEVLCETTARVHCVL
jgi:hypothetical protein